MHIDIHNGVWELNVHQRLEKAYRALELFSCYYAYHELSVEYSFLDHISSTKSFYFMQGF